MGMIPRPKPLNIFQQDYAIRARFPGFQKHVLSDRKGSWVGTLRPADGLTDYRVKVVYQIKYRPRSYVLSPKIELRDGATKIEHTYGPNERPCLFMPEEWNDQRLIADTVIPWLSLWLFYYEMWHLTGKWLGGGHTFAPNQIPRKIE